MKTKQIGDVIQTRLYLRPLGLSVCFYEIDHLLFDTGAPSQRKHLKKYLMDRPLEQVVVSHHHEDHTGMADWLERKKNLPIYMLPETQRILNHPYKLPMYRYLTWGQMRPVQGTLIGEKIQTNRFTFDVVRTPGHCQDHLSLVEPNHGFVFSGDLFVSSRIKYSLHRGESLKSMLQSIEALLSYDFQHVFCAHAGFVPRGRQALEKKKKFLHELVDSVLFYYQEGQSLEEIREKLHPQIDWNHLLSRGEFSSRNVVRLIIDEFSGQV
ncbi:MBL fold metallo-hydrolase [Caldalkalibacillus mannanilyticus]|uniref:MBL fold metallo-hydrolase n=1 Tax=Caldalkalibacillus mannanilyticus TaxID=1418 RepID=UPI000469A7F8|nr:MBL fold metallo-hydrolase [Caldalkalibacillus mannanilyticus]